MGTFLLFTVNSETRDFHLSFYFYHFLTENLLPSPRDMTGSGKPCVEMAVQPVGL